MPPRSNSAKPAKQTAAKPVAKKSKTGAKAKKIESDDEAEVVGVSTPVRGRNVNKAVAPSPTKVTPLKAARSSKSYTPPVATAYKKEKQSSCCCGLLKGMGILVSGLVVCLFMIANTTTASAADTNNNEGCSCLTRGDDLVGDISRDFRSAMTTGRFHGYQAKVQKQVLHTAEGNDGATHTAALETVAASLAELKEFLTSFKARAPCVNVAHLTAANAKTNGAFMAALKSHEKPDQCTLLVIDVDTVFPTRSETEESAAQALKAFASRLGSVVGSGAMIPIVRGVIPGAHRTMSILSDLLVSDL